MSSLISTTLPFWTAADRIPARAGADGLGRLAAADRVGEEDQIGVGRHDELGVQLRVPAGVAFRLVGDVPQPEQAVELTDERRAVGAEERRNRARGRASAAHRAPACRRRSASMSVCICSDQFGGFADVAGGRAELLDLGVGVVEGQRRRAVPPRRCRARRAAAPRPLKSPPISTRSGSYAAMASTFGSKPDSSCGSSSASAG